MLLLSVAASCWILLYGSKARWNSLRKDPEYAARQDAIIAENISKGFDLTVKETQSFIADWITADRVYSHRGSAGLNEHSFEAYDEAIAAGSHNLELDAVISKDGTIFISHDLTSSDMTDTDKAYSEMSDEEIDKLRTNSGGKIIKLSEVFDHYGESVKYLVEIKSENEATLNEVYGLVVQNKLEDNVVFQSDSFDILKNLENANTDIPKLYLAKSQDGLEDAAKKDYVDEISANIRFLSDKNCKLAHDAGKRFSVWTVNTEDEIKSAIRTGADAYFTDDTSLALKMERKYRGVEFNRHSTFLFASDYQPEKGFKNPKETLKAVVKAAADDGKMADEFIFCGDYTNIAGRYDYEISPENAIGEMVDAVRSEMLQIRKKDMLFVQGNHDRYSKSIANSGLHEFEDCLVYVLNTEDDFPWRQGVDSWNKDIVIKGAEKVKTCLDELVSKGETRPVFIAAHIPLHYTARTSSKHTTGDNLYADIMFEAINEAAKSLDIIYLYGHNHGKGWDCYMGGAAVYKAPGEELLLPDYTDGDVVTDNCIEKELNFSYMNAGYVGYYMNCAASEYSSSQKSKYRAADETLSCTAFDIYPDRIEISRYDEDGRHVIGAAGEANPYMGGIDKDLIDSKYYSDETPEEIVIKRKSHEDI